jgi:hypothetical protein
LWDNTQASGNYFGLSALSTYVHDNCNLSGNYIGRLEDFVGLGGKSATVGLILSGNHVVNMASDNIFELLPPFEITGNTFLDQVYIPDVTGGSITGNQFMAEVILGATTASKNFRVTGNLFALGVIVGDAAQVAVSGMVSDNKVYEGSGALGITVTGNYMTVSNNNTIYDATHLGNLTVVGIMNSISGNTTGWISVSGTNTSIRGNSFMDDLIVTAIGDYHVIEGNVGREGGVGKIKIYCNHTTITGNMVNTIWFDDALHSSVITGNQVTGNIDLGSSSANQIDPVVIVGNMVTGNISVDTVLATSSIVVANNAANIFTGGVGPANILEHNANN